MEKKIFFSKIHYIRIFLLHTYIKFVISMGALGSSTTIF